MEALRVSALDTANPVWGNFAGSVGVSFGGAHSSLAQHWFRVQLDISQGHPVVHAHSRPVGTCGVLNASWGNALREPCPQMGRVALAILTEIGQS